MAFDLNKWTESFKAGLVADLPTEFNARGFLEALSFEDNLLYHTDSRKFIVDPPVLQQAAEEFGYKVAMSRAKLLGREMSPRLALLMLILLRSPGEIVMYVSAMHALYPTGTLTATDFHAMTQFKLLSEKAYSELWDMQKGVANGEAVDNCLDYLQATS